LKKRSFPHPFSTPDDWLREVLEFFPADAPEREGEGAPNRFLINFGGHYMPSDVVALAQAMAGAVGCAIDSDDPMTYASPGVTKHVGFVTLANVGSLMTSCATPRRPLLLKMDVDSVDVDITLAVLAAGYSPAFIFVELNEKVPPPICYCNRHVTASAQHQRGWERLGGHHYGCSLTGFVNALAPRGYRLVSVILNDALFVAERHAEQVAHRLPGGTLPTPEAAFAAGYRDVPGRSASFPWNSNVNHWLNESRHTLAERGQMVSRYFVAGIHVKKFADFAVGSTAWPCRA